MLASPDPFNGIEEDFRNLQETKSKLNSPHEEEKFEIIMQGLRSRWEEVKSKITELHPRMQIMAENFSDYKDKLNSLTLWVQKVDQTCEALDCVQDYNEFQPLMEKFQVLNFWPQLFRGGLCYPLNQSLSSV